MLTKVCPRCKTELPLSHEFWPRCRREATGFYWWCKQCVKQRNKRAYDALTPDEREQEAQRKRAWEIEHRDQLVERRRNYREENRESIRDKWLQWAKGKEDRLREQRRAWSQSHPEAKKHYRETHRAELNAWARQDRNKKLDAERKREAAYRESHREQLRANARKWAAANLDSIRVRTILYRARKRGAPGRFGLKDIREMYAAQEGRCAYCGCTLDSNFHVDHVIPLVLGGTNGRDNLALACPSCNRSKGAKLPADFQPKPF